MDEETSDSYSSSDYDSGDEEREVARSAFGDMLHDWERNQKYHDALKLAIAKLHQLGKKANVLDIGTGSGLLSMMAANCGADSVTACEAFEPMAKCATRVLELNSFKNNVKVIPKHSTKLTVGEGGDLPQKANILVAEVFDTELIGEHALSTFKHALRELLEPDCIVVPNSATIFVQVVECEMAMNWRQCKDFYDTDGSLLIKVPDEIKACPGSPAVHDIQLSQISTDSFKQICEPRPVFHFDWSGKSPIFLNQANTFQVTAESSGKSLVIFMWWELSMDPDNTITLSCAPYWAHPLGHSNPNLGSGNIPWRDHWLQAIYYLPKPIEVTKDETLNLTSCHDKVSLWFYLEKLTSPMHKKHFCNCGLHLVCSHSRFGEINDDSRRAKLLSVLKKHVTNESVILVIGDGSYFALAAAKFGAKKLLFLNEQLLCNYILKEFIEANNLGDRCEILNNPNVLASHPDTKDITMILGEPHFTSSIWTWNNMKFGDVPLDVKEYVTQEVTVIPKQGLIKGILVECKDLHKTRCPIETCGEFDMKPFDDLIQLANRRDPIIDTHPLWEYPCIAKSSPLLLTRLNLDNIMEGGLTEYEGGVRIDSKTDKSFNALVFWTEWILDDENVISNGPVEPPVVDEIIKWDMHTRQGIAFVQPKCSDEFYFSFRYNIKTKDVSLNYC